MRHLKPLDITLLAVALPLWGVWFTLQIYSVSAHRLASLQLLLDPSDAARGYQTVVWVGSNWPGGAGLQLGDVLLAIKDEDLAGASKREVIARILEAAATQWRVPLLVRRAGQPVRTLIDLQTPPSPAWAMVWGIVSCLLFAATATLVLLRAHAAQAARALFLGFILLMFYWGRFVAGPRWITYITIGYRLIGALSAVFQLQAALFIPAEVAPRSRFGRWWPWLLAPVIVLVFLSVFFDGPLSARFTNAWLTPGCWAAFALGMVAILASNFRRAGPAGRRQIKWVVLGFSFVFLQAVVISIVQLLGIDAPALYAIFRLSGIALPICVLIAVVGYNLYDVDRVISATTSYTILVTAALAAGFAGAPALVAWTGTLTGLDTSAVQMLLAGAFAAIAVPAHRWLRPQIDQLFFPESFALERGVDALLHALSSYSDPAALFDHLGERLNALLRPESCVLYFRSGDSFEPALVRGPAAASAFDSAGPLIAALSVRASPIAAERWSDRRNRIELSPFDRAALATLGAAVVLPIRRSAELVGFVCLGRKASGDVYTATDVALLAAVAHKVSGELLRFDLGEVVRQGHAMQEALRRYVPGSVVSQLESGRLVNSGEREVSILFVDLRKYTTYAEGQRAEDVFSTINRYTEEASAIVSRNGGSLMEFSGDGLMAVFGAPEQLEGKERAAVEAGREIVDTMASLLPRGSDASDEPSVGVGIATGLAFIGEVRAVDRRIWTAIGDTVNLAARLQALTRMLGATIVVDARTWQHAGYVAADFVRHDQEPVRGRTHHEDIYTWTPSPRRS
jgi:class 3 adenylate cyclase